MKKTALRVMTVFFVLWIVACFLFIYFMITQDWSSATITALPPIYWIGLGIISLSSLAMLMMFGNYDAPPQLTPTRVMIIFGAFILLLPPVLVVWGRGLAHLRGTTVFLGSAGLILLFASLWPILRRSARRAQEG
jgi:hypothetical protein